MSKYQQQASSGSWQLSNYPREPPLARLKPAYFLLDAPCRRAAAGRSMRATFVRSQHAVQTNSIEKRIKVLVGGVDVVGVAVPRPQMRSFTAGSATTPHQPPATADRMTIKSKGCGYLQSSGFLLFSP